MTKHKITGFASAFEERLAKTIKRLKKLRKSDQWKNGEKEEVLKTLEEAKRLRTLIRELKEQDPGGNHRTIVCPSCGKKIKT